MKQFASGTVHSLFSDPLINDSAARFAPCSRREDFIPNLEADPILEADSIHTEHAQHEKLHIVNHRNSDGIGEDVESCVDADNSLHSSDSGRLLQHENVRQRPGRTPRTRTGTLATPTSQPSIKERQICNMHIENLTIINEKI